MFPKSPPLVASDSFYINLFLFSLVFERELIFTSVDSVNAHLYIALKYVMSDQKQSTKQEQRKANGSD